MSASREKQKRRDNVDTSAVTREEKLREKQQRKKRNAFIYGGIALVFVVVFVVLLVLNSNAFLERKTAATVGDESVSVVDFDYYYKGQINNYANYFGDSWSEYSTYFTSDSFVSGALSSIQNTAILTDAADAAGYTLTDADRTSIDQAVSSYESYAEYAGYASADGFIEANYGKGCSVDSYRAWLEDQYLASGYQTVLQESYSYTDAELDAYYDIYKDNFDTVSYRYFFLSSAETDEMTAEEAAEQAKTVAEAMADQAAGNEAAFNDLCAENAASEDAAASYKDDPDYSLVTDAKKTQCGADYADWLFDAARIEGETTAIESTSGWYVLYFVGRATPDYNMVNVRHILIRVEDTTDTAAMSAAQERAETLLTEWQSGDATEDSFAQLAIDNSDDGNAAEGGLYENITQGQMVDTFNDWCFDPARQSGDTGIVETSYGYHIMYFSGEGDAYLPYALDQAKRSEDYSAWYAALTPNYETATKEGGLKYCNLDIQ